MWADSRLRTTMRRLVPRALRPAARAVRTGVGYWRRSLQLRVVAGTLILSTAVIVVTGWILLQQVTAGLLQAKTDSSVAEASTGIRQAQETINVTEPTDDANQMRKDLAFDMASRGFQTGLYDLILQVDRSTDVGDDEDSKVIPASYVTSRDDVSRVDARSVPTRLRDSIELDKLAITYTQIVRTDGSHSPGLVVGSKLWDRHASAELTVFYLFDLTQEQDTLTLLQRSLVAVGVLIVALLGFVALFVTRQVVTPVRIARKTAERLAAGVLDERMQVRGQDDLARLATSFNQMAASLQRQIRQLEELSRVQRRFVSDVSHELRTPLTTVRMAADLLYESRAEFDPATARSAELLQAELDRFESLLSDLLEISRFDAGAAMLDPEDIDLRMLTQRVVDGARRLAERKGSLLTLWLSEHPCVAQVDPRRIERVVRNLVVNAIEYGEGRDIDVQVAGDDHATAVSVRDHGMGLKPGESAKVFERFWRADPARARTTGGTGLGLAIAMEDVLLHGGWLQAWGEPGRGAHFRLTVPRRSSDTLDHSPIPLVPEDARRRAAVVTSWSGHVTPGAAE